MSSRPLPRRARDWAEGWAPGPVVDVGPIGGGITNTKWLISLAGGDRLVLRWSDPQVWGETGREHVRREALGCRLLEGSTLPVPRLVATDLPGADAGGPANLMTWRPGRTRLDALAPDAISAWARVAGRVHGQPVRAEDRPPGFTFWGETESNVPGWSDRPELWRQAIDIRAGDPPPTPATLLHRDFHLGNTLWQHDTVTGLVDWAETSWGPPDLDIAHACSDLAMMHSVAEVITFRAAYVRQGGRIDPDPLAARYWLVFDILGFLPDPAHILASVAGNRPDLTADTIRQRLESLLAFALDPNRPQP